LYILWKFQVPIYFIHVYIYFLCLNCALYIFVFTLKFGFIYYIYFWKLLNLYILSFNYLSGYLNKNKKKVPKYCNFEMLCPIYFSMYIHTNKMLSKIYFCIRHLYIYYTTYNYYYIWNLYWCLKFIDTFILYIYLFGLSYFFTLFYLFAKLLFIYFQNCYIFILLVFYGFWCKYVCVCKLTDMSLPRFYILYPFFWFYL